MSMTLGEKLRQAREERGITLSDVAEHTRISPIYLESIDNDDYSKLPGGIFNRGFVKSYAKYVGLNEQEALLDYSRQQSELEAPQEAEARNYRPEVLTDDRNASSMLPTLITAAIILAVMTGGILLLLNYLRQPADPAVNTANRQATANTATEPPTDGETVPPAAPDMSTLRVEVTALNLPVSVTAVSDGKESSNVVAAGSSQTYEPRESLTLSYSRSLAPNVQLEINGKAITPPAAPLNPKRGVIEFTIDAQNLAQIWNSGAISQEVPAAETNTAPAQQTAPAPRPSPARTIQANAAPANRPPDTQRTPARPAASPKPPGANRPQ